MTRRKDIEDILSQNRISLQEIANIFGVELKEILEDVEHIKKSRKLVMFPAQCKKCGFVFRERSKIKTPSKCPRCKHERIQASLFTIKN